MKKQALLFLFTSVLSGMQESLKHTADTAQIVVDRTNVEATTKGLFELLLQEKVDIDQVRELLKAGAEATAKNEQSATPLHLAAIRSLPEVCLMLLEAGAVLDAFDKQNWTPFNYALQYGSDETNFFFAKRRAAINAQASPLHVAAMYGRAKVCQHLLQFGYTGAEMDHRGLTPLHFAAMSGSTEASSVLLSRGASIDSARGKKRSTPLYFAAGSGHKDLCLFLILRGAGVHATTKKGRTFFHKAASKGHIPVCLLALEYGANFLAMDINELTPLHVAVVKNKDEAVRAIIRNAIFWQLPLEDLSAVGEVTPYKRMIATLGCLRLGLRLPYDLLYLIITSDPELADDALCVLMPLFGRWVRNGMKPEIMQAIPLILRKYVAKRFFGNTIEELKQLMGRVHSHSPTTSSQMGEILAIDRFEQNHRGAILKNITYRCGLLENSDTIVAKEKPGAWRQPGFLQ